ncbi:MAG: Ig-like domain-containing protein [Sedimentisphaerales bacterium]|nr:Ig-like domain-containing protein [Sedimentisphaerales bacterium]
MKRILLSLVFMVSSLLSVNCWGQATSYISTSYRVDSWNFNSHFAPVAGGYVDVYLMIDNATFTDLSFSVNFDSDIINPYGISVQDIADGLTLSSVTTEDLEGTWKKATINLTGNISIGTAQYLSDAAMVVRFLPLAEGVFPLSFPSSEKYPEHYKNCSLSLSYNGQPVEHEPHSWHNRMNLFTFTDKDPVKINYHYDYNFGFPIEGYLRIVYADDSIVEFHSSDPIKGITIDPANGAYYITPQENAVSYSLIFPGYEDIVNMDMSSGSAQYTSHTQPTSMFFLGNEMTALEASAADMTLEVNLPGIGTDFSNSTYTTMITGDNNGILSKQYSYAYINDDTISVTIIGGLPADYLYMYVFKDGDIQGRTWFHTANYYPVTFIVKDQANVPVANATVILPMGWDASDNVELVTDSTGQAQTRLAGESEYGNFQNYRVIHDIYDVAKGTVEVYGEPVSVEVTLSPLSGTYLDDFVNIAYYWQNQWCSSWDNDCQGADMNFDGKVTIEDLAIFAGRWLK